jgi:hypothetical protein
MFIQLTSLAIVGSMLFEFRHAKLKLSKKKKRESQKAKHDVIMYLNTAYFATFWNAASSLGEREDSYLRILHFLLHKNGNFDIFFNKEPFFFNL